MKSEVEKKKQVRFLMVMPLLTLPFLTIAFVTLGGGSGAAKEDSEPKLSGLTAEVPGAHLNNEPMDKLGYYQSAKSDSSKKSEMMKNDPYYQPADAMPLYEQQYPTGINSSSFAYPGYSQQAPSLRGQYVDPNEARVYQRLNAFNNALNMPQEPIAAAPMANINSDAMGTADVDRLEKMMLMMQGGSSDQDPELKQLSGMLENILDIQHPERAQEKLRKASAEHAGQVFSVAAGGQQDPVSVLVSPKANPPKGNGFFGLADDTKLAGEIIEETSIKAVVHQTQTLVEGAIIKLRLLTDIYINGTLIPKDNFVYGVATLNGERLSVSIASIRFGNSLFPVKLSVYDLDGLDGIHIPGAIGRDVAKQSGTNALQGLGMSSLDPSLGVQAASAGIELSKSLLSKKVKQIKVTVKAGYQVLLKDQNNEQ